MGKKRKSKKPAQGGTRLLWQQMLQQAVTQLQGGDFPAAERSLLGVLKAQPQQADALHFLGVLSYRKGNVQRGLDLVTDSIRVCKTNPSACINYANMLIELDQFEDALKWLDFAIELQPDNPDSWSNRAVALMSLGRREDALESIKKGISIDPRHRYSLYSLASLMTDGGASDNAITVLKELLDLYPDFAPAYKRLSLILVHQGELDQARELLEKWQQDDPDNPTVIHHLAAIGAGKLPERCSDDYVAQTFDSFADSFDNVLHRLEYNAHKFINEALAEQFPDPSGDMKILDAGCGTGLAQPLLAPYASQLIGVDLSAGMLHRARVRGGYEQLVCAEITEYCNNCDDKFDLIVCADTLCYFGDLSDILAAFNRCSQADARLIFTVEEADDSVQHQLTVTGRYAHSSGYIEQSLSQAGMEMLSCASEDLRKEGKDWVKGLIVVARKLQA